MLGGGSPLHALEDQKRPSLVDHFVSGKQADLGSAGSRTFSRKHHDFELSLASGSNLGNEEETVTRNCERREGGESRSPGAVSARLSVAADLDGVLALGAPARVAVHARLLGRRLVARRRREEVVVQLLQAVGGRAAPVGDGARHRRVDAGARDDGEPEIVALVSCGTICSNCQLCMFGPKGRASDSRDPGQPSLQSPHLPSMTIPSSSTAVAHQTEPLSASVDVQRLKVWPPYLKGNTQGSRRVPIVSHVAEMKRTFK